VLVAAGVLTFVTAPDVATSLVRADPREGRSPC
jgi:hypothetical protein